MPSHRSGRSDVRSSPAVAAEQKPPGAAGAPRHGCPLRLRAILAVLLIVPAVTLFAVWGDWLEGGNGAAQSLNGPAVGMLAFLTALNLLLRRRRPLWAFSSGELITIYLVVAICMGITGGIWQWGGSLAANIACARINALCRSFSASSWARPARD